MIDDVNFSYGSDVTAYNIYSDGKLIATVSNGETTYTVEADNLEDGEHTFAVTAVYANGQESRPATATLTVTVGISDLTATVPAASQTGTIYSLDGKRDSRNVKSLKGTFIINNKKVNKESPILPPIQKTPKMGRFHLFCLTNACIRQEKFPEFYAFIKI